MKLLLHICCAPCAAAIVEKMQKKPEIDLSGYYYNPNIHPLEEHDKRKRSVEALSADFRFPVDFRDEDGLEFWRNRLGENKELRCSTCYSIRLNEAAKHAMEKGFDAFTTSLLISPYQNHELIRARGEQLAEKFGLQFYYEDFRELYRRGREIARGKGYYMQKYCGCMYSYHESDHPKKPIYTFEKGL